MIPASLSATSLHVAKLCLARWEAEFFGKAASVGNRAADVGSTVHLALEKFVDAVIIKKTNQWKVEVLEAFYQMAYIEIFHSGDLESEEYVDGWELCQVWYARTDVRDVTVLSIESKEFFNVKTSAGEIPLNFIIDRLDDLGDGEYRVVDYKTIRWAPTNDELRRKEQARIYALAVQIKFPDAKKIWVQFDTLRHKFPVTILITREENIATWKQLKSEAERIIATPAGQAPETLNAECRWCIRKLRCMTLRSNIVGGGSFSVEPDEAAKMLEGIVAQQKGLEEAAKELEKILKDYAKSKDITAWELPDGGKVEFNSKPSRSVDGNLAEKVLGPTLFGAYGGKKITMATVDKLLKGDELDDKQKAQLRGLIQHSYSEASVKVTPPPAMEE